MWARRLTGAAIAGGRIPPRPAAPEFVVRTRVAARKQGRAARSDHPARVIAGAALGWPLRRSGSGAGVGKGRRALPAPSSWLPPSPGSTPGLPGAATHRPLGGRQRCARPAEPLGKGGSRLRAGFCRALAADVARGAREEPPQARVWGAAQSGGGRNGRTDSGEVWSQNGDKPSPRWRLAKAWWDKRTTGLRDVS